jgi:UPF0755 protein
VQATGITRILKYALPSLVFVGLIGLSFLWHIHHWSRSALPLSQPTVVKVSPQIHLRELTEQLHSARLIDSSNRFLFWVKAQRIFHKIQAGTYRFAEAVSPAELLDALLKGPSHQAVQINFTIPEGFNLKQILTRMVEFNLGSFEQLWALAHDPAFIASLHIEAPSLEGFLYPATYFFYEEHPSEREVFAAFAAEFAQRIPPTYRQEVEARQLSFYQAVIFASMIEKETDLAEERSLIAEVIWRRLKANIPLAIDAAVIYGSVDYQGRLKSFHLKDRNNPYNPRIHRGLPPTPIASPTVASLAAVLTPSTEGYMYYVLLPGNNGKHHFAKTLESIIYM